MCDFFFFGGVGGAEGSGVIAISQVLVIRVLQYLSNFMSSVMNNEVCLAVHYLCELTQTSIALGILMQMVNF